MTLELKCLFHYEHTLQGKKELQNSLLELSLSFNDEKTSTVEYNI